MATAVSAGELSYEAWLDHMFGQEVRSDSYPWFADSTSWYGPEAVVVDYMTRLFETPAASLEWFSDGQISAGLWHLTSEHYHDLYSQDVPVEARERCIGAIATLFLELFQPRCAPVLGHIDQPGAKPLNSACYMWWENIPFVAQAGDPHEGRLNGRMVQVMEETLGFSNPACQESALHGLGHWRRYEPEKVAAIIGRYLDRATDLPPELERYARSACRGCIL